MVKKGSDSALDRLCMQHFTDLRAQSVLRASTAQISSAGSSEIPESANYSPYRQSQDLAQWMEAMGYRTQQEALRGGRLAYAHG